MLVPNARETAVKNKELVYKCDAMMAAGSFSYMQSHGKSENPNLMPMSSSPVPHTSPPLSQTLLVCKVMSTRNLSTSRGCILPSGSVWAGGLNTHELLEKKKNI